MNEPPASRAQNVPSQVPSGSHTPPLAPMNTPSTDQPFGTVDADAAGSGTVDFDLAAKANMAATADKQLKPDTIGLSGEQHAATATGDWATTKQPNPEGAKVRQIPKTIAGYDILGVLGRGAMGVVYKVNQRGLKLCFEALKMILAGEHASEQELSRFKIEAEAVARIQHPNIVQIYRVGEHEGLPYFSLEYVEGGTLAHKVKNEPLAPREAARIVGQLSAGIACAHLAGIIHRDLKPTNVLMAKDGTPKITDFGLAKRLEEDAGRTASGAIMGTPNYMSPEQAEGRSKEVGPLADVYALGIVLYELLTGTVPFKAPTIVETLELVRTCEPVRPSYLQLNLPGDLETICLHCIEKDPKRRYAGAAALAEDLRRFLDNEPILARPVGRIERTWRWCRRNPRVAGLTTAIALALVGWAVSMTWLSVNLKWETDAKEEAKNQALRELTRANKEAELTNKTITSAINQYTEVAERSLGLLNARTFIAQKLSPELSGLRDDILSVLRTIMLTEARELEASEASKSGMMLHHEALADVLKRLGQREEALKEYRRAFDLAEKATQEQLDSDKAKANLGVILLHLGEMHQELYGEAQVARDFYEKGRKLRQDVADHPRSGDFTERDTKSQLAHYERLLGHADLALGDPKGARDHFDKLLALRTALWEETPGQLEARSYLVQAYVCDGISAWHLGEETASTNAFAKAVQIQEELVKERPNFADYKSDLADLFAQRGQAQRAQGKVAEAEGSYRKSLEAIQQALQGSPGNAEYYLQEGLIYEALAGLAELRDDRPEAEKGYQKALDVFRGLLPLDQESAILKANAFRVSAHNGKKVAANMPRLEELSKGRPQSIPLLLNVARCAALGAQTTTDAKQKEAYLDKTMDALNKIAALGYRDGFALKTDPDLQRIKGEPRFEAFLAKLPKP